MKKLFATLTAALALSGSLTFASAAKTVTIDASDSRITYVGRTLVESGSVGFDWSATRARIEFSGAELSLKAGCQRGTNYFNVWIDKAPQAEPDKVIKITGESDDYAIVSAADFASKKEAAQPHKVTIEKRTEGSQGKVTFFSFTAAGFSQAEPLKERMLEFVGDSYTCGYGSENSLPTDRFTPETENTSKTYAAIISRYFDADYVTIAHSGLGVTRSYGGPVGRGTMITRYGKTFDEGQEDWDAASSDFKPAATVIYLGTNDFSVNLQPQEKIFVRNYINLLTQIKANYGEDHPIICVSSPQDSNMFDYVRRAVEDSGLKNVCQLGMFSGFQLGDEREFGADYHPNYNAHRKLAYSMIPYIATATLWPLNDTPVK